MARFARNFVVSLVIMSMLLAFMPAQVQTAGAATPTELFFSEYIEGSSNNKALEIYNGTGAAINLATGSYNIQMYFNGNATASLTINLTGMVAAGDVYVLAQSAASAAILAQADQTNGSGWFNGDDAVVLRKGTTVIDVIGQIGFDPGTEWGTGLISTADNTLRRKDTICTGEPNGADVFDPSLEWEGFANDTFGGLGAHTANCAASDSAPTVTSSYPTDGATDIPLNADMSITFSEPVNVATSWYTLSCAVSGNHTGTVSGGPTTFTINPTTDFVGGETCTLTVLASKVTDQDANDPPDTMSLDFKVGFTAFDVCAQAYTPIYQIQGNGATVALTGTRTTQGVVVADYEGASPNLRGFFIQDPTGDGNLATSDGIFVFEGSNANTVSVGDLVRVTGTAGENQGQSQISVGTIVKCGTATVTPTEVTLPFSTADYAEAYEGMLVRLPQTLYVTEHYLLGRFGEVLLSSGGRLKQPTNVVLPGAPALELQAANDLNQIIVDDASQAQNPDPILFGRNGNPLSASNTLRGGDTATGIVGVMTYTWAGNSASPNAYRVRPINALGGTINFEAANPRPTSAPNVGGTTKVVGMNVLNFFNTLADNNSATSGCFPSGTDADCRGATSALEFERQWVKTVAAIVAMDADVVGFNEIENDGYGADSSIAFLVDKLNAATAPGTYAFIDVDTATGQVNALGNDAIRVGMIYKPAKVTPIGQTAVLNTDAFVNGGDSAPRNRPSLMQAFQVNASGARFIVDINHLKSKGSACEAPDALDGQGNCNQVRVNSVQELLAWFATDPTGTHETDLLMLGDYNSYAKEDPITTLETGGFTNLVSTFIGEDAYSYVFDGQWGYLDQALGTASLTAQVAGVGDYHIDADEPSVLDYNTDFKTANLINTLYAPDQFRISDHDPVIVGLNLRNDPPVASTGGPYLANEGETVALNASGYDPDHTSVTFAWDLDNDYTFETPGQNITFAAVDGPATFPFNLQVTDETGLSTVVSTTLTVDNLAPTVDTVVTSPEPSTEGGSVTASATFSDPGLNDAPFVCTVNYGDGTGELGGVISSGNLCTGPAHIYPAYGTYNVIISVTDKDGDVGSNATTHAVIFNWNGFFQPVHNPSALNVEKAGQAIPLKFGLGGDKGLNIFVEGYPVSTEIACDSGAPLGAGTQTNLAGSSDLAYDPGSDQYHYVWKTEKAWSGTCRQVTVQLTDGTFHSANFQFK